MYYFSSKVVIQCITLTYFKNVSTSLVKPDLKTQFIIEVPTQLPDKFTIYKVIEYQVNKRWYNKVNNCLDKPLFNKAKLPFLKFLDLSFKTNSNSKKAKKNFTLFCWISPFFGQKIWWNRVKYQIQTGKFGEIFLCYFTLKYCFQG